jgi:acetolactate synthase-1/2/3 large subunit
VTRTGGRLLVDSLIANGIVTGTCVPGESFLAVLDAIYEINGADGTEAEPGFRLVTTRHEAAAANMAEAIGKLDGRPAVCFVTRGPGALHASIAVHTAYQDGTPMILVIGQVATTVRGREAFQELDYSAVLGSTAKHVVEITQADRVGEHVARAVHLARSGRPGPVVLVVPEDMLTTLTDAEPVLAPPTTPAAPGDDLTGVLELLSNAQRPLLVVGGPKWSQQTAVDVRAFAERNEIPVVAAFRWQDAVDNRSLSYVGYLGLGADPALRTAMQDADVVVALGARLDDPTTDGFRLLDEGAPGRVIAVVLDDEAEAVRTFIPDAVFLSSVGVAAARLAGETLTPSPVRGEWTRGLRQRFESYRTPPPVEGAVDLARIIRVIRDGLPDDAIVTNGAGNYTVWLQRFFEFRRTGTQLAPRNGAMGYGLPAALGAAVARPGTPVVAFAGDGCLLMSGSELATAVQERLPIVLVVVNNAMLATIRMHQENAYPGHVIATDLDNPDFVAYARSFGAEAHLVTETGEFAAAFSAALAHHGPTLIEVRTDPRQLTPERRLPETAAVS